VQVRLRICTQSILVVLQVLIMEVLELLLVNPLSIQTGRVLRRLSDGQSMLS